MTWPFRHSLTLFAFAIICLAICPAQTGFAQDDFNFGNQDDPLSGQFGNFGVQSKQASAEFESKFKVKKGSRKGTLSITGMPDLVSHSHLYSQKDLENQEPTRFKLLSENVVSITGPFVPDVEPEVVEKDVAGSIWVTEEFSGDVTWTAPIEFKDNVAIEAAKIEVQIDGQVCNEGGCLPFVDLITTAKFDSYIESDGGVYRAARPFSDKVEWSAKATPAVVKPGDIVTIEFTAKSDEDWHIYGMSEPANPTRIVFRRFGNLIVGETIASTEPEEKTIGETVQLHHEGTVTFTTELTVPEDTEPGDVTIDGRLGYQTCNAEGVCLQPTGADFNVLISVADQANDQTASISITKSKLNYEAIVELYDKLKTKTATAPKKEPFVFVEFLRNCGIAFLAGLILNVMPCVLPVIGLKMMSFVEQSGEDRKQVFALNIAFSLGLMTVFWGLAFFVVFLGGNWGDLLNEGLSGAIILSAVVFAFGLSLIGVWEIPIPGFASSNKANKLAEKEGLSGAFLKGILTTVLATPCVGPLLVPAMAWAITQSTFVAFSIFTVIGIGMAFPFLMVAVVPSSIKFLPKPGAWMETFKQVMGFVMLATVIFLLNTFSQEGKQTLWLMAVLSMLLSIGVGCWWIGRTSIAAETSEKIKAYVIGGIIIAGGTYLGFTQLGPSTHHLEWQPFTMARLNALREKGQPVFIDFTGPG
ncbi:protein-disulfide reductase DsbD family protein [Pirellulaceae bacterium]|nr:protein-disulfide reductase DsbD family protein [Pirellulaceae bacterium]